MCVRVCGGGEVDTGLVCCNDGGGVTGGEDTGDITGDEKGLKKVRLDSLPACVSSAEEADILGESRGDDWLSMVACSLLGFRARPGSASGELLGIEPAGGVPPRRRCACGGGGVECELGSSVSGTSTVRCTAGFSAMNPDNT